MKKTITSTQRKSGIELLRIIAIFMVICLHRAGNQTLYSAPAYSVSYYVLWFVQSISYQAVNIFFIISGYFGVTQTMKTKKLLLMECKVLMIGMLSYLLCIFVFDFSFQVRTFVEYLCPYVSGRYWYYTAYVSLLLLSPWINAFVRMMKKQQLLLLLLTVTGISTLSIGDAFFTNDGYSVIWAMNLYLIGAYIRLHVQKLPKPTTALLGSVGCTGFIFGWFVIVGQATYQLFGTEVFSTHFLVYRQLPVVLSAVFLVIAFLGLDVKGVAGRWINRISAHTFGVYLLHSCVFMDVLIFAKWFPAETMMNHPWYWLYVLGSVVVMFVLCLVIDIVIKTCFRPLEQAQWLDRLDAMLCSWVKRIVDRLSRIGQP